MSSNLFNCIVLRRYVRLRSLFSERRSDAYDKLRRLCQLDPRSNAVTVVAKWSRPRAAAKLGAASSCTPLKAGYALKLAVASATTLLATPPVSPVHLASFSSCCSCCSRSPEPNAHAARVRCCQSPNRSIARKFPILLADPPSQRHENRNSATYNRNLHSRVGSHSP